MSWYDLSRFPEAFKPLVVVVGDRRERRPRTRGDLLAYSASALDLLYLNKLQLPPDTPIISDKIFVVEPPETLEHWYKHFNILTIGSPAVNLFSRLINEQSLFRLEIDPEQQVQLQRQEEIIQKYRRDLGLRIYSAIVEDGVKTLAEFEKRYGYESTLADELFANILEAVRDSGLRNYRQLLRSFEGASILDPIDGNRLDLKHPTKRGLAIRHENDFGMISVARHPYVEDDQRVVVYVAGRHGPATAAGVRLLAERQGLIHRRLGGVFEVHLSDGAFSRRVTESTIQWDTKPYELESFEISDLKRPPARQTVFYSAPMGDGLLKEQARWVVRAVEDSLKTRNLRCYSPYHVDLTFTWNYVSGILKYFPPALFVIHNVTNMRPGVLFEIGCSIGFGKAPVLIHDEGTGGSKLPAIIGRAHVHRIDLSSDASVINGIERILSAAKLPPATPGPGPKPVPRSALVVVNPRHAVLQREAVRIVKDVFRWAPRNVQGFPPAAPAEEPTATLFGICASEAVLVDVTDGDQDGLIALGIARALGKKVVALYEASSEVPSMFDGRHIRWHVNTLDHDLVDGLQRVLD